MYYIGSKIIICPFNDIFATKYHSPSSNKPNLKYTTLDVTASVLNKSVATDAVTK